MQAQHRPESEHSEEGRQDAAPPAGSETGGILIAQGLVDFLLEHGFLVAWTTQDRNVVEV